MNNSSNNRIFVVVIIIVIVLLLAAIRIVIVLVVIIIVITLTIVVITMVVIVVAFVVKGSKSCLQFFIASQSCRLKPSEKKQNCNRHIEAVASVHVSYGPNLGWGDLYGTV